MAKRPATGNGNSATPPALQKSLIAALPSAPQLLQLATQLAALGKQIDAELHKAKKAGPVTLARAYVVLHRLCARIQDELSISDSGKVFGPMVKQWATVEIPAALEQAGISHVPLDEGFRVGISSTFRASIKEGQKGAAYEFLRSIGLPDIITETVNASTLSAAVKKEIEERNREFPDDLFNVAVVPNTSVTVTK